MRMAIKDNEVELGFQLIRNTNRRKPALAIYDLRVQAGVGVYQVNYSSS